MLVDKDTINNQQSFVLKWAESPFNVEDSPYAFNPGWQQPTQVESFYRRMEEKSSIIKDGTRVQMESLKKEIDYLRTEFEFDDVRYVQKLDKAEDVGKQIQDIYKFDESRPFFHRKELEAKNLVAYSLLPETFLRENIEKESFLSSLEAEFSQKAALAVERIGMYGVADPTRPNGRSAMDSVDGVFSQLQAINKTAISGTDMPQGFGSPFTTKYGNLTQQFMDKIDEFVAQNGRDEYAQFYVSRKLYNKLLQELSNRETAVGDAVLFDGKDVTIFGTPIKRVDFLNPLNDPKKRNGWGHMALLCDPSTLCWGFFNEVNSRSTYEHDKLSYLTSIQCAFDVLPIWEQDILAFGIDDFGTGTINITIADTTGTGINGATIEFFDPTSKTPDTALYTGTTADTALLDSAGKPVVDAEGQPVKVAGKATIADVPYGKYTVKVTAKGYKTQELEDTIVNNNTETMYFKMKK